MAIKIPKFKAAAEVVAKNYTYKDISLDIKQAFVGSSSFSVPMKGDDIRVSYDTDAIANSLYNLFNTRKGERYLFPEYGSNIERFLFAPVNTATASLLADEMSRTIRSYEPRITLTNIGVDVDEDNQTFTVNLKFTVKVTRRTSTVSLSLKQGSPVFLMNGN